ncbi:MAG: hypothetical protein KJ893_07775 [Candidatus Omnitrophica bacterium]|nr:hypothetical protein [Candidatus Omnitrophota bacterium]MBU4479069.1 hypothetical protein [Candidatus Omnitrophota bacterium]MCG2704164.1 LPS assembly lipoprotein LptE [Candidatus Omnitrophota bacterium]
MRIIKAVLLCASIALGGCGYTTKACFLPTSIRSVYVETFQNDTDQPNLENELRTRLIAFFQNDGNLKIASADDADAVLKGKLLRYSRQALRYANDETIEEYRLVVSAKFEFIDRASKETVVKADDFPADTSYFLQGSSAKSESTARSDVLDELSRRIVNKIITLW